MMRSKPGTVGALWALKRPEMEAFPSTGPSGHGRETWENFRHLLERAIHHAWMHQDSGPVVPPARNDWSGASYEGSGGRVASEKWFIWTASSVRCMVNCPVPYMESRCRPEALEWARAQGQAWSTGRLVNHG